MENPENKKKILVTLTGGGFRWEAKSLIEGLGDGFQYHFVTTHDSSVVPGDGIPEGEVHVITRVTTMADKRFIKKAKNFILCFRDSYRVIKKVRPDVIVCVGTSIAVPLCLWGKLLGRKTVYVESITRVSQASLTGKILSFFRLCDRHYVQWPEAVKLYKRAVYGGTVL
ncbi:MAG: hypothetical protein KAT62_10520 [Desulfuromonadales bacterium]|nr:hypothetical protein [Desulfuromonadales bacterium]